MDVRMITIERKDYDRFISYDADRANEIIISSGTDDIAFNRKEGEKLYKFLKDIYEEEISDGCSCVIDR